MQPIATLQAHATATTPAINVLVVEYPEYGWFYVYISGRRLANGLQQFSTQELRKALDCAQAELVAVLSGRAGDAII